MARYQPIFKLGLAIIFYAAYCIRPMVSNALKIDEPIGGTNIYNDDYVYYQGVQGKPGVDFPVHSHIPRTAFTCKELDSGYYADLETDCQVFHVCEEGKKISFLCPNGTIFQQSELICEWWFKVNCTNSPDLYEESSEQLREDNARRKSARRVRVNNHSGENDERHIITQTKATKRVFTENPKNLNTHQIKKNSNGNAKTVITLSANLGQQKRPIQNNTVQVISNANGQEYVNFNKGPNPVSVRTSNRSQRRRQENHQRNKSNNQSLPRYNDDDKILEQNRNQYSTPASISEKPKINLSVKSNEKQLLPVNNFSNDAKHIIVNSQDKNEGNRNFETIYLEKTIKDNLNNSGISYSTENQVILDGSQETRQYYPDVISKPVNAKQNNYVTTNTISPYQDQNKHVEANDHHNKNSQVENKGHVLQQKVTGSFSKNDLPNKSLELNESEESQIPQETASFYKSSLNRIKENYKPSSLSIHSNHKDMYEELKEVKYNFSKIASIISSVTPQYLTTQPINNGKPFLGSQVGSMFKRVPNFFGTTEKTNAFTQTPLTTAPTDLFNVGKTDKTIETVILSTIKPTTLRQIDISVPSQGSFNVGSGNVQVTSTPQSVVSTTKRIIDHATVYGKFIKSKATTPIPSIKSSNEILTTANSFNTGSTPKIIILGKTSEGNSKSQVNLQMGRNSIGFYTRTTPLPLNNFRVNSENSGFYVTKDSGISESSTFAPGFTTFSEELTSRKVKGKIVKPRPFQLPPKQNTEVNNKQNDNSKDINIITTLPTYKISSASPFNLPIERSTLKPTAPTPFSISKSSEPSVFKNVDSMINALAEMANQDYSLDTPRPGLVVPPSAGPQTLHTLAVYFANALDGIAADKEEEQQSESKGSLENITQTEKKKLTALLTKMTMNRYNELFNSQDHNEDNTDDETTTPLNVRFVESENNDLEGQHSKNPVQIPKVRQLAKVFTQALSSYLDDPATFKRVLEEVRPTEPSLLEKEESTDFGIEDELLNFSDADAKSSFPPIFPTAPSVRPTWGYLVRYNISQDNFNEKNYLSHEQENLQGADSQSFVSQFNKLNSDKNRLESTTRSSKSEQNLPVDHWTSSPGVTKLWKTTFSFDPAKINDNLGTTESFIATFTEKKSAKSDILSKSLPHHEIKYELRALPQLALNSTQVHGILIDFMNTTKSDETNRLQRILRKLNTTEDEFLAKMREIETNPLTRRLILLLISECGTNATKEIQTQVVPVHTLLNRTIEKHHDEEILEPSSSNNGFISRHQFREFGDESKQNPSNLRELVDSSLDEESQDARALQLLNSLYSIASKFGK